jgi:hypothetical protein
MVYGHVEIHKNVLWNKGFEVIQEAREGLDFIGSTQSAAQMRVYANWTWTQQADPNFRAHRPGGCTGCKAFLVSITPFANQEDERRAFDFDLSCISSWNGCKNPAELYRSAFVANGEAVLQGTDIRQFGPGNPNTVKYMARDSYSTQIVRVINLKENTELDGSVMDVQIKKEDVLNGTDLSSAPTLFHLERNDKCAYPKQGQHYIVFFDSAISTIGDACEMASATTPNLIEAQKGIEEYQLGTAGDPDSSNLPNSSVLPVPAILKTPRTSYW